MFSWDDFNKDESFYNGLESSNDLGNLPSFMMLVTNALKQIDYNSSMKSGNELMMKIFNMSNLAFNDENDDAFNVMMALISHIYAMLLFINEKDDYFNFFDQAVINPMIKKSED